METIIGFGNAGCNIAQEFSKYPQYQIYLIDTTEREGTNFFLLPEQETHEAHEAKCPSFKKFFSKISGQCLFVVGGGSKVSGASLRALSFLKDADVSILYIHPDTEELQGTTRLQHNVVFGILQEYTRSGLFSRMYISQNSMMEEILQEIPVIGYHAKINELLVSTVHMTNVFKNTDSEFDTFKEVSEPARLTTFGIVDIEKNEEKLFFDLTMPREKCYYLGINREQLVSDGTLMKGIKEKMKVRLDGKTRITYGIYSTDYDDSLGYCIHHSSLVQQIARGAND